MSPARLPDQQEECQVAQIHGHLQNSQAFAKGFLPLWNKELGRRGCPLPLWALTTRDRKGGLGKLKKKQTLHLYILSLTVCSQAHWLLRAQYIVNSSEYLMNGPGNQGISQCPIVNSMQTIRENCFTYFLEKKD